VTTSGRRSATTLALALVVPLVTAAVVVATLQLTSDPGRATVGGRGAGTTADAIRIIGFRYAPDPLVVRVGARVTVTNEDGTVHTVTAEHDSFDTGDLGGGATGSFTIAKPGTYKYYCAVHDYMTGTIEAR
jgi:plastocyanin